MLTLAAVFHAALSPKQASAQNQVRSAGCSIDKFAAPELCARAGLDTVRARFVVLVDESGSMRPLWPGVRRALASFARAIPDGDELDVWAFSGDARRLISPTPASADLRTSWERTLSAVPEPKGSFTDLGLAARSGLDALSGMESSRVGYVIVLTDGRHEPGPTSRFPSSTGSAWDQLAADAEALTSARPVTIALIRVSREADLRVLQTIFPSPVLQDALGSRDLEAWFLGLGREIAREKLVALVRQDLARPAARILRSEPAKVHSGVVSEVRGASIELRRLVVTALANSSEIALGADGSLVPTADMLSTAATLHLMGPPRPIWQWPGADIVQVDRAVNIRTRLEPAEELARLGVGRVSDVDSLSITIAISPRGRLSDPLYYAAVGGATLLLGLFGLRTKRALHRPALRGTVLITPRQTSVDTTRITLGEAKGYRVEIPLGVEGGPALAIEARNVGGRTSLVAIPIQRGITCDGKPIASEVTLNSRKRFSTPHHDIEFQP